MNKKILFFFLFIVLLFSSCTNESNGYKVNQITYDEISVQSIKDWLDKSTDKTGYYEYVYSDPDSWDMLIYSPNINEKLEYVFYKYDKIEIVESTIKIYFTKEMAVYDSDVKKDFLFHLVAPTRGAWPAKSELFIDGKSITCISRDFSK